MQKHVLLADSDPESLERLAQTLRKNDYRVSMARDGAEGYRLACELEPDCVVFDVDMDNTSGTLMYCRLRRNRATRNMAAIVHSQVTPRYGTGIRALRKMCAPAELLRALREVMTPHAAETALPGL